MVVNSQRHDPTAYFRTQHRYRLNWRLVGYRTRLDISGEEKNLTPVWIQNPYIPVRSLVTKTITLSRPLNN
jgi:hypothetical protein